MLRHMPIWVRTSLAGLVLIVSAIVTCHISLQKVDAPTTSAGYGTRCGANIEVALTGSGYNGGEPRAGQDAFDTACAKNARHNMVLAIPLGLIALISLGYLVRDYEVRNRKARQRWEAANPQWADDTVD